MSWFRLRRNRARCSILRLVSLHSFRFTSIAGHCERHQLVVTAAALAPYPVGPRRGLQVAAGVPLTAFRQTLRPSRAAEPRAGVIASSARPWRLGQPRCGRCAIVASQALEPVLIADAAVTGFKGRPPRKRLERIGDQWV
jgi:hypothetical protein